ncbi:MAG: MFS transporter [Fimbriimonadaceae bacterium]|nr:MFS transporter [Chitinophagales bacterium]
MASEMLYPIMPIYLKTIGFSVLLIGVLEGFAETIAGLSKGYFGQLSDVKNKRLPFVQLGYSLSAISKPLLAIFTFPFWVFFARTIDRVGKGLRTAPRDAMLSLETTKENKAKVFGFHRSMDTLGAVSGPSIALLFLYFYPGEYKILFLIAFVPGIAAVMSTFLLKEKNILKVEHKKIHFFSFTKYHKTAAYEYRKLLFGLIGFALVNSSDVLLLLKMKESGINDVTIISVYIFYNLIFAIFSFPAGVLADKVGIKKTFISGLILFALVYAGFAFATTWNQYLILFILYGLYASCTEGIAKAWISNIVPPAETGTAIGTYAAFSSISAFIASSTAGLIWYTAGPQYAFGFTACVVIVLIFYFTQLKSWGKM